MVKLIAFYLPQFHEIPENNLWWGKGFTEWDNVRNAKPFFFNHDQPRIPDNNIGYYDLMNSNFLEFQHGMALRYGLHGFCYYYYNFDGHTLLEGPLKIILNNRNIKNNYCICWANESWTRAWYGQNKEVLIEQRYSEKNAIDIFYSLKKYFSDTRYIKINGMPLFVIYNPCDNHSISVYSDIWKYLARKNKFPGIFLVSVESLIYNVDPASYGFDASIEFAPDWTVACLEDKIEETFRIYDYKRTAINMMMKSDPNYIP